MSNQSPISPSFILNGLRREVIDPMRRDVGEVSQTISGIRKQYPTVDMLAGLHPYVAGAQVVNDVRSGDVSGDTALSLLQSVPLIRKLKGVGLGKGMAAPFAIPGMGQYAYDPGRTAMKNAALTTLPVFAGAAESK